MKKRRTIYLFISIIIFLTACTSNILDVKLDNKEVFIEFINADAQLYQQPIDSVKSNLKTLENQLGDLFIYELSSNIRSNISDSSFYDIYDFYNSEYIKDLEEEKSNLNDELINSEKEIDLSFQYLSYHFGEKIVPKKIFYINKLFSSIHCSDSVISVGLENYISPNSVVINSLPSEEYYQWQKDRMDIKYLSRDVVLSWIQVHLFSDIDASFAEHLIQTGKVLYVLNSAFPKQDEAFILRYSEKAYKWAKENETAIWNYMVEQQLLFSKEMTFKTNFLNEGPTTVGLAPEAPDRIGQYIGFKIVKGFMSKNKKLSLPELLEMDYNSILQTYKI